jgi:hypothetical protein
VPVHGNRRSNNLRHLSCGKFISKKEINQAQSVSYGEIIVSLTESDFQHGCGQRRAAARWFPSCVL